MLTADLLFLLLTANGAPILLRKALGGRGGWPVDGGRVGADGRRLLGPTKTWRGLAGAVAATALAAPAVGLAVASGAAFGAAAMLGDLLSSFLKRRLGVASSGMALGLDQLPEAILPLLAVRQELGLDWDYLLGVAVLFLVLELLLSRVLFALHIREHPH